MFTLLAQAEPQVSKWYEITAWVLIGAALLAFLLTSWRDVYHIFFRAKDLGTGLSRIWAVARTAIFEAWAARIWVVLPLWIIATLIINSLVVPYKDSTDTVSLYASVCLYGQMFMVLISLMVLASFSCGRERERRTIITTGSKPLSRLEFFLGKIVGFSTVGAGLLVVMGVLTYGYLLLIERNVRGNALATYHAQEADYANARSTGGDKAPPDESLKNVANGGVLVARNIVPAKEMEIAGLVAHVGGNNTRYLKGGSGGERMILHFPTVYTRGILPTYGFQFVPMLLREDAKNADEFKFIGMSSNLPPELRVPIDLRVTIKPARGPEQDRRVERTVRLAEAQAMPGLYVATWTPEVPQLYIPEDQQDAKSPIDVEITCATQGIYLEVWENRGEGDWNVAVQADPRSPKFVALRSPEIVGFEKYDKQQIEGPRSSFRSDNDSYNDGEVASFRFSAADMKGVPRDASGNAALSMYLDVDKRERPEVQTRVDVEVYDQRGTAPMRVSGVLVNEKVLTQVQLPLKGLQADSDIFVDVRSAVPGHWISLVKDSVRFELAASPYLLNLMKSEMVIWFSAVLLVTVAVVASVRVNGWVAMLVAGMAYFLGYAIPLLQGFLTGGGLDNILSPSQLAAGNSSWFYKGLMQLQILAIKIVYVIAQLLPDFRRFDPTTQILQFRNMSWMELGGDLGWMALFAAPMIAVGYLMIRKQELA